MGENLLAALMTIDMNGPDIEEVDEVKRTHATRNVYSQLSGLEDVVFNDVIISFQKVMVKSRQIGY